MASAKPSYENRKDVIPETPLITPTPRSLKDIPYEMLLKILSHVGPDDLCFNITKVCERWKILAKDVIFQSKVLHL
jgi:hypothetical protein